jgi:hypothetical protein
MAARRLPARVIFGSLAAVEHACMKVRTVNLCNNLCSVQYMHYYISVGLDFCVQLKEIYECW